jgi:hypothetical protein
MIVAIHQPHYFPWPGYFDKIDHADVFVILDSVQFEKNGWQNRNRIKTPSGWGWLTVPVKHSFGTVLSEMTIENTSNWPKKHYNTLAGAYARSPYWREHEPVLREIYSREWEKLADLNEEATSYIVYSLGISSRIVKSSSLGSLPEKPNARLAEIVRGLGGDTYLAGGGAAAYFDEVPFLEAGIRVIFQDYKPCVYKQLHGEFIPGLSTIDILLNEGPETLEIIRAGRRTAE